MALYLGLMSGTSMDAIDAALVDFDATPLAIIAASATAFEPALKTRIASLMESADRASLDEIGQVDVALAQAFAQAAIRLLRDSGVDAGSVAAIGSHGQTLRQLMSEPYLALPPPKSTGRELFNMAWLQNELGASPRRPQDVQATLLEYTAATITAAARRYAPAAALYVCGGGAHNAMLCAALARLAAPNRVATTAALGLDPDYVEAVAFAWFARRTLAGLPSSAGSVTGARGARILGGVYRRA
ncbi:MAG: anhydro-N-acetylmuramic acid kinase [Steroidobacteraceae bacterium]